MTERISAATNEDTSDVVGERPYEMADRKLDHTPLVDFQDLAGWQVVGHGGGQGQLVRTREQRVWGDYSAGLTYSGTGPESWVEVRPPRALPIPGRFDSVDLWCYGNDFSPNRDPARPLAELQVRIQDGAGRIFDVSLGPVNWREWFVAHGSLPSGRYHPHSLGTAELILREQRDLKALYEAALAEPGEEVVFPCQLVALLVRGCAYAEPRTLYFEALSFYERSRVPLAFEPRPELPFPTTPDTILPAVKVPVAIGARQDGDAYVFTCEGDERLEYRYQPKTGTLGDIAVVGGGLACRPMAGGGIVVDLGGQTYAPDSPEVVRTLLGCELADGAVRSRWRLAADGGAATLELTLRAKGKSLVVDATVAGGAAREFSLGHAAGVPAPELHRVPFLTYGHYTPTPPHVLATGDHFLSVLIDWYTSEASLPYGRAEVLGADAAALNGGSVYIPRTDGRRNDLRERIFVTLSRDFQEVLPTIPNPKSPMGEVTRSRLWRHHWGYRDYESYYRPLHLYRQYGVEQFIVRHHEDTWRDAFESFTLRLVAAPKKGGDAALKEHLARLKALGYRAGLYNNYRDYAAVSAIFDADMVGLQPDGDWRRAWPRTYLLKPARSVELEAYLAPRIGRKFEPNTVYCDVHTFFAPWESVDYDSRVPGAGTYGAVLRAHGELLLQERISHQGPVYSEGSVQCVYAGLADGNYGSIVSREPWKEPWLVDFDLLTVHNLEVTVGMGAPYMYYEGLDSRRPPEDRAERLALLDRFLCATLAFGHVGFLLDDAWGLADVLKSYHMVQQAQVRYALVPATRIAYHDPRTDELLDTSAAVRTGVYRNNQVHVRYRSGLEVYANGSFADPWDVSVGGARYHLPPTGYVAALGDELLEYSAEVDGHRVDFVRSPAYSYADGRGRAHRFPGVRTDGGVIVRATDGQFWVTPVDAREVVVYPAEFLPLWRVRGTTVLAFGEDQSPLGAAPVEEVDGGVRLGRVEGAISYRLLQDVPSPSPAWGWGDWQPPQ